MASLNIRNVEELLLWEIRMAAAAERLTVKDWVRDVILRALGEQQEGRKPGKSIHSPASLKRQRCASGQRGAKRAAQNESLPHVEAPSAPRGEIKACKHGLLFHPGCTD